MRLDTGFEKIFEEEKLSFEKIHFMKNGYSHEFGYYLYDGGIGDFSIGIEPVMNFCGGIFLNGLYIASDEYPEYDEDNTYEYEDLAKWFPFFDKLFAKMDDASYSFVQYISSDSQECHKSVHQFLEHYQFKPVHVGYNQNSGNQCTYWIKDL